MDRKLSARTRRLRAGALVAAVAFAMVAGNASALPHLSVADVPAAGTWLPIGNVPIYTVPEPRGFEPLPFRPLEGTGAAAGLYVPMHSLFPNSPGFGRRGFVWLPDDRWSERRFSLLRHRVEWGMLPGGWRTVPMFWNPGSGSSIFPLRGVHHDGYGGAIDFLDPLPGSAVQIGPWSIPPLDPFGGGFDATQAGLSSAMLEFLVGRQNELSGVTIETAPVAGPTTVTLAPEPGTAALLALGLISVALHRKRSQP